MLASSPAMNAFCSTFSWPVGNIKSCSDFTCLEECNWLLSGHVVADSVTAGGRMRRRRGFRSYITSTLALPEDAAISLALIGSSLAARPATALDAS